MLSPVKEWAWSSLENMLQDHVGGLYDPDDWRQDSKKVEVKKWQDECRSQGKGHHFVQSTWTVCIHSVIEIVIISILSLAQYNLTG